MVVKHPSIASDIYYVADDTSPTYEPHFIQNTAIRHFNYLNFKGGTSGIYFEYVVNNINIKSSMERIKKDFKQGKTLCEKLDQSNTATSGKLVAAGSYRLGKDVFPI